MNKINLQDKAKAKRGTAEMFWFENEFVGLQKTLFHRLTIPLTPFDSGLDYESQPVKTEIVIDWLVLNLVDPTDLDGLTISHPQYEKMEASVYIGGAHNWCDVNKLTIHRKKDAVYLAKGDLFIDFENEGVAQSEVFSFETTVKFIGNGDA
jgi:hypothetical protein